MDTTFRPATVHSGVALWTAALGAGFVLVTAVAAQLLLWNGDTIFLLGWLQLIAFGLALVLSLSALFKDAGWWRVVPLAICIAVSLIVYLVPFRDAALTCNFARLRSEREDIARAAIAGKLKPDDTGVLQFDSAGKTPAVDGFTAATGVALSQCGAVKCVLFFTFQRSKFQPAEGFLFVPDGGDP